MPKQLVKFPASPAGGFIEIDIADFITQTISVDIPNEFPVEIKLNPVTAPDPEPPIPEPEPPQGEYFLSAIEDFDQLSDLSPNQIGVTSETASLAKYFSTSITKDSPGCFKSIVPAGGNSLSSGNRSEQQFNDSNNRPKASHNPIEGAYDYWAYYENWDSVRNHSGHTFQVHPFTGGASAILSIQNYGGTFEIVKSIRGMNTRIQSVRKSVVPNTWMHHRIEFKWSTGSDGYVRVYVDNTLICNYKGQTADGSGQYTKLGQNKWGSMSVQSVVYYDTFKVYKKI